MFIDPAFHGSATCAFALRNLHKSPRCASRGPAASAAGTWAADAPGLRRLVEVSFGWPREGRAFDLRVRAAVGERVAVSRVAGGRFAAAGRRLPAAARGLGCTFFSVCCGFVIERAVSCTFFSVCCISGRTRGDSPSAALRKTAGQTNDDETAHKKDYDSDAMKALKKGRFDLQTCNKPKKNVHEIAFERHALAPTDPRRPRAAGWRASDLRALAGVGARRRMGGANGRVRRARRAQGAASARRGGHGFAGCATGHSA